MIPFKEYQIFCYEWNCKQWVFVMQGENSNDYFESFYFLLLYHLI